MEMAYFILKNVVITFVIVNLLQMRVDSKPIETHLMGFVRKTLAPQFLGKESLEIDESLKFTQNQIDSIKEKIRDSGFYKKAQSNMKKTILEEIQSLFKEKQKKREEQEEQEKDAKG